jgi:hypothetical protein
MSKLKTEEYTRELRKLQATPCLQVHQRDVLSGGRP